MNCYSPCNPGSIPSLWDLTILDSFDLHLLTYSLSFERSKPYLLRQNEKKWFAAFLRPITLTQNTHKSYHNWADDREWVEKRKLYVNALCLFSKANTKHQKKALAMFCIGLETKSILCTYRVKKSRLGVKAKFFSVKDLFFRVVLVFWFHAF